MFENTKFIRLLVDSGVLEIIILYVIIITPIYIFIQYKNQEKAKKNDLITQKIIKAFENDFIKDLKDIENIYSAITTKSTSSSQLIINILQLSSVYFYENKFSENKNELIIKKINYFIDEINKKEPFSDLPLTERNVLNNLLAYKEDLSRDKESYISKLHDLSHIIKIKYDENNELLKKNSRHTIISYFVGIVGIIISIYLTIDTKSEQNNNDSIKKSTYLPNNNFNNTQKPTYAPIIGNNGGSE